MQLIDTTGCSSVMKNVLRVCNRESSTVKKQVNQALSSKHNDHPLILHALYLLITPYTSRTTGPIYIIQLAFD